MKEAITKVINQLWMKAAEHDDGVQDAESLFQQKYDEGASDAYEWAANRLKEVLTNDDSHNGQTRTGSTDDTAEQV